jgi:hypothetical protein
MQICVYSFTLRFEWSELVAMRHQSPDEFLARRLVGLLGHDCFVITRESVDDHIWRLSFLSDQDLVKAKLLSWLFV